jgi:small-conductance mechanosensitive channel
MKQANKVFALTLVVLLAATIYGLIRTKGAASSIPSSGYAGGGPAAPGQAVFVDQAPLLTAQALAQMPTSAEEAPFAQGALQLGDQEMDLAFALALLDATEHPPALSPDAKQIETRLQKAEDDLAVEQAQVAQITAADAKAAGAQRDALDDQLQLAKARQELSQDQVDDAKEDLIRAGGDPQDRIQAMVEEHEVASQSSDTTKVNVSAAAEPRGLVQRSQQWWTLHQKQLRLWRAKQDALTMAETLSGQHESLDAQADAQNRLAARPTGPAATASGASPAAAGSATGPTAQSATVLAATKRRAAVSKTMSSLDKRISNEQQLAATYAQWISVVAAEERVHVNRALRGILVILAITLIGLLVDLFMNRLVGKMSMDRRQMETLRSATRVSLQIVTVLLVLLVVFGPPTQLGTFLGLAGAGLTVALKDFIIAFIGWFVLMGKSGIRLGDWVEINGVSGEVVDLGMFHTVLLETGNWTDSGHPTGRRVTFTNSYAVEGHYFNFSTSGQWMWDELKVVLPGNQNPYPLVTAIQKKVTEATAEVVRQAEQEWKSAAKSHDMNSLSAAPTISVKPVVGGTEITVRYITSARQRSEVRAKLNQAAVDLLGIGHEAQPAADAPKATVTAN